MDSLSENVLVLNNFYLAIKVCSAKDAVVALANKRAKVIDESYTTYNWQQWISVSKLWMKSYEMSSKYSGTISSPSTTILIPQVIIFNNTEYINQVSSIRYSRKNIFQRDGYRCQYCGAKGIKKELTLDHITPKSKGGKSTWTNIVTSCKDCNQKKGNKLLSELKWKLLKTPKQPNWKSHVGIPFNQNKKEYWQNFLS